MIDQVVAAYSAAGASWQLGPGQVYDRLAEIIIARLPLALDGRHILDVGAGTGAVTRAALAAGAARVTAVDAAIGMLLHDARQRPPAVVADVMCLPIASGSQDASVAAFSLNHLTDPAAGLREMTRVTRAGGVVLASTYASDDVHPVKDVIESVLAAFGWASEPWHDEIRANAIPLLATADGCASAMRAAGLDGEVEPIRVPFADLAPADLVAWRLGMAQHAPFVASLAPEVRRRAFDTAVARLGANPPPLVRSILVCWAFTP